jgi:hypothetical protein
MTRNYRAPAETDRRARGHSNSASVAATPAVARVQPIDWPAKGCCWPMWRQDTERRTFCAEATPLGIPYCAAHMAVAYVKREAESAAKAQ